MVLSIVHTLSTLPCPVSRRYFRMLRLCWVRSCNKNGHFFSFNTRRFCSILTLVLCLVSRRIIGQGLVLLFPIRRDLLMSLVVISSSSSFLKNKMARSSVEASLILSGILNMQRFVRRVYCLSLSFSSARSLILFLAASTSDSIQLMF